MTVRSGTTEHWHHAEALRIEQEAEKARRDALIEARRLWEHELAVVRHYNATRGWFTTERPEPKAPVPNYDYIISPYRYPGQFRIRDMLAVEAGHHGWRYMEAGDL